jgi:hypothetical protein
VAWRKPSRIHSRSQRCIRYSYARNLRRALTCVVAKIVPCS